MQFFKLRLSKNSVLAWWAQCRFGLRATCDCVQGDQAMGYQPHAAHMLCHRAWLPDDVSTCWQTGRAKSQNERPVIDCRMASNTSLVRGGLWPRGVWRCGIAFFANQSLFSSTAATLRMHRGEECGLWGVVWSARVVNKWVIRVGTHYGFKDRL